METLDDNLLKPKQEENKLHGFLQFIFVLNAISVTILLLFIFDYLTLDYYSRLSFGTKLNLMVYGAIPSMLIVLIHFVIALVIKIRYGWSSKVFRVADRLKLNFSLLMIFIIPLFFLFFK